MNRKVLFLAYSDIRFDPRISKQFDCLLECGYDVSFYGVYFTEVKPKASKNINMFFRRSKRPLFQYIQYILLMVAFFFKSLSFLNTKPIVVVANMPNFLVSATFLIRWFGGKVVLDVHDDSLLVARKSIKNRLFLKVLYWAEWKLSFYFVDELVTVNKVLAKELLIRTNLEAEVIHNCPDVKPIAPDDRSYSSFGLKLVFIGNLGSHYGLERMLNWVRRLILDGVDLTLDVYGGGVLEDVLRKRVLDSGMQEFIFIHGRYEAQNLSNILINYDLGLALYEESELTDIILPVKILEYLSIGLGVITVPLKTTKLYFNSNSLFYVEGFEDFSTLIKRLVNNVNEIYNVAYKGQDILAVISWEKEKSQFISLIEGL